MERFNAYEQNTPHKKEWNTPLENKQSTPLEKMQQVYILPVGRCRF
jgi:hypothetical protein